MSESKEIEKFEPPQGSMESLESQLDSGMTSEVNNALSQLINISNDILHEPTCIICSNPYRDEIEQKWLKTKSNKEVQQLIKDKSNVSVSNAIIENHMTYHLNQGVREIQKIEYKDRLSRLSNVKLTTLDRIDLCFSALTERLVAINSITPSGEYSVADIEKIKSAETTKIMSSFDRLLKLQASILGEMKTQGELITIPRNAFVKFFTDAIANAQNDREREITKKILTDLSQLGKLA